MAGVAEAQRGRARAGGGRARRRAAFPRPSHARPPRFLSPLSLPPISHLADSTTASSVRAEGMAGGRNGACAVRKGKESRRVTGDERKSSRPPTRNLPRSSLTWTDKTDARRPCARRRPPPVFAPGGALFQGVASKCVLFLSDRLAQSTNAHRSAFVFATENMFLLLRSRPTASNRVIFGRRRQRNGGGEQGVVHAVEENGAVFFCWR